jgi:predicted metal-binding membrane protein
MHASANVTQPFIVAVLMWQAMMTAMMAPTVIPWLGAFHRFADRSQTLARRAVATGAFASGYLVVWLAYSVCAAAAQSALQEIGVLDPQGGMSGQVSAGSHLRGAVLLAAGLFQLAPLKRACLTHCRNPLTYFIATWRGGAVGGFRMGLGHGAYCVGCCWALMATALALGAMNLWWMAALTSAVFVEQVVPRGQAIRVPLAVALVAAGVSLVLR